MTNTWLVGRFWISLSLSCGTPWTFASSTCWSLYSAMLSGKKVFGPLQRTTMSAATSIGPWIAYGRNSQLTLPVFTYFSTSWGAPSSSNRLQ